MTDTKRGTQHRTVRSFVLRKGRITHGQQGALARLWPNFGVVMPEIAQPLDLEKLFGNTNPVILEIGFGNGETVAETAVAQPNVNLLGVEVHQPGVGHLLMRLEATGVNNVRVICHDAMEVLDRALAPLSVQRVQLFFPDPWPKKKHHKRRIVQPRFLDLVERVLAPGGLFHFATDWHDYADHVLALLEADTRFVNTAGAGHFTPRPAFRPVTKFEHRGKGKGHSTWDLIYRRR